MLSILVVDTQVDSSSVLKKMLDTYCPSVTNCELAENSTKALRLFNSHHFDLVFLTIFPSKEKACLDLARQMKKLDARIVLLAAHEKYALEAFRLRVYHFMLEPIKRNHLHQLLNEVIEEKRNPRYEDDFRLRVNSSNGMLLIPEKDIIRIEGDGSYSRIYRKAANPVIVSRNLGKIISDLRSSNFLRIHQSHLINLRKVKSFINNQLVELCDGSMVPVSRRRKDDLLARL